MSTHAHQVTDYGAKGDGTSNDTDAVLRNVSIGCDGQWKSNRRE